MRRILLALVLVPLAAVATVVPACSSNGAAPSNGDVDAAILPDQPVGQPCNPALTNPCLPGTPCFEVSCDPVQGLCVQTLIPGPCANGVDASLLPVVDAAQDARPVSSGCFSSAQCPDDTVCGFLVSQACAATGLCVLPEPPTSTTGAVYMGCGCDGQPVAYVTPTETSAPVASALPCTALGDDAGSDAALDASLEAGNGGDASDASLPDGDTDAAVDAGDGGD